MSRSLSVLLAGAFVCASSPVGAQTVYYAESFDSGIPAGYVLVNNNGASSSGWIPDAWNFATPAVEHEDEYGAGQVDNDLQTVAFDLSATSAAWLHLESVTHWANFQANHPASIGNGVSAIEVSTDGGATWSGGFWTCTQTQSGLREDLVVDLGAFTGSSQTMLRLHYEGDWAHNWAVDELQVDDQPLPPPLAARDWSFVALPTAFSAAVGYQQDFDLIAGILPVTMAATEVDAQTLQPDPEGWCNIGQKGPHLGNPYSGSYFLEMAKVSTATSGDGTRNALVFGLNGGQGALLSFQLYEGGDEPDDFDGVWVSDDGDDWYRLHDAQSGSYSWVEVGGIPLDASPADVSGNFYLMFAQEDDRPWPTDGIGFDDIRVALPPPAGPNLALSGVCGVMGGSSVQFTGGTPDRALALYWDYQPGSYVVPAGTAACIGTTLGVVTPHLRAVVMADTAGSYEFAATGVPMIACGSVYVQVLDVATCTTSNLLAL